MSSALVTARRELTDHRRNEGHFIVRCAGLTKHLKSGSTEFHLRDISLELVPGDILGVVGSNASGKSTLLDVLAGRLKHDSGELAYPALCPNRIDWRLVRERVAYVPQTLQPWSGRLADHLRLAAAAHGFRDDRNEQEVMFALYRLELEEYQDHRWQTLSGGYKVRFELARALVSNPTLLVLDEPLAPLDIRTRQVFLEDLSDLAASVSRPVAVVVSSQDLYEIESIATHILFLDRGKPQYCGDRAGLFEARETDLIELDCRLPAAEVSQILQALGPVQVKGVTSMLTVEAPRTVGVRRILQALLDGQADIYYFRDISQSSRRLFERREELDVGPG